MKIVCDCGQEMEFKKYEDWNDEEDDAETSVNVQQDYSKMEVHGEHDEIWITCGNCNNMVHFFT